VREAILAFLRDEMPEALPRRRVALAGGEAEGIRPIPPAPPPAPGG